MGTGRAQAYFYWVTREASSLEWFKGVMDEVAEMDKKVSKLKTKTKTLNPWNALGKKMEVKQFK